MIDYLQMMSVLKDKERLEKYTDIVSKNGTVQMKIQNSEIAESLLACSKSLTGTDETESVLEKIADLFSLDYVLGLLRTELKNYADSDLYTLSAVVIEGEVLSGMLLYTDQNLSIALTSFSPVDLALRDLRRRNSEKAIQVGISIGAQDTLFRFLHAETAHIASWSAERIDFETPVYETMQCSNTGTYRAQTGSSVFVRGGEQSWSFESATDCVVMLSVTCKKPRSPVVAQYHRDSGRLEGVSAADDKASRVQILSTFLRAVQKEGVNEIFAPLLDHRDHFVRWHVMREMIAADQAGSRPFLERLKEDKHPQVAEAARATAALLEGE